MSNDDDNNSMTGTGAEASALDNSPEFTPESEAAPTPVELPTFLELGVRPEIVAALEAVGITRSFAIQALTLPGRAGRPRHHRPGQDRHRQDPRLRRPAAAPGHRPRRRGLRRRCRRRQAAGPGRRADPRARRAGGRRPRAGRASSAACACSPSTAAAPTSRRSRRCSSGVDVVVGTPGRLLDLAQQGHLDLGHARIVVLDEADEMLDLGFLPDIERMLALTPAVAADDAVLGDDARRRRRAGPPLHDPADAHPGRGRRQDDTAHTVKAIEQFVYRAHALDKVEMLARILQAREPRPDDDLHAAPSAPPRRSPTSSPSAASPPRAVHGDLGQGAREQALRAFRNGKVDVLVATDVAARGIDVDDVTHVINYQCPEDEKTYVHRIGRTGRAGNTGIAVTFVDWDDLPRWTLIDKALDLGIPEPVGDLLHLAAPLHRPRHPRGHQGPPAPRASGPARAWTPRSSRTSARPASVSAPRAAARPAARAVTGIATAGAGHAARAPPIVGTVPTARTGPTAPSAPRATPHGRRAPGSAVAPAPATRSTRRPRRIPQPRLRPPATPPTARVPPLPAVAVAAAAAAPPQTPSNPRNLLMLRG